MKARGFLKVLIIACILFCKVNAQNIYPFAFTGSLGNSGDGGQAVNAECVNPFYVAADAAGNVYISDQNNNKVRKVNTSGIITTFAGTGNATYGGDGASANFAHIKAPGGVAFDASGNVYIADTWNHRVRKVDLSGIITTFAGDGTFGFSGDGGPATNAKLNFPQDIATDASGNIYIADAGNTRVRKVDPSGIITTFAGTGVSGWQGDGGPATSADLEKLSSLAVDGAGNLFIVTGPRVRKVNTSGIISTYAGTGSSGFTGDGGPATSAKIAAEGIAFDASGNLYIADGYNHRVRVVSTSGIISTFAGNGVASGGGDGGLATIAQLNHPQSVAVNASGNVIISDSWNNRIRIVCINDCLAGIPSLTKDHANLKIYPNPNNGVFSIKTEGEINKGELTVRNALGQVVHSQELTAETNKIDLSHLAAGLYSCILLEDKRSMYSSKLSIE
ncbi:MAG: T9SS type A sorting domain-containing protein [Bacteroidetes bacterium]|nr:T9SS type A sorting domain-containing protein [Bacteroidota bacterium]